MFVTILCFLSVAMTIVVIHLHTNSVVVHPTSVPKPVIVSLSRYLFLPITLVAQVEQRPACCFCVRTITFELHVNDF